MGVVHGSSKSRTNNIAKGQAMGELNLHDLNKYISDYGCNVFVETGTGTGTGLTYAIGANFKKVFSIEINTILYNNCRERFTQGNVKLINAKSVDGLKQACANIVPADTCLFWLDAHFPGADFGHGGYDDNIPHDDKYPLESEIRLILDARSNKRDVFIVDDLQIYEPDANYELKAKTEFLSKHKQKINFEELFSKTHDITRDYRHQGFIIMTPKSATEKTELSILIPSTPRRADSLCKNLIGYLTRMIESGGHANAVQLLWLGDNYTMSIGKKRNLLLSMAEGEYLAFIDDDDSVAETYFDDVLPIIRQQKPDVVTYKCVTRVDGGRKTISSYSKNYEYRETTDGNGVVQWTGKVAHTMVWRSEIAKRHKFPEKNWQEDMDWVKLANADIGTEIEIPKPLYFYRMYHKVSETR